MTLDQWAPTSLRDLDLAVVRACPDHALLERRLGDRVDDAGVFDGEVVHGQPAGVAHHALVVRRQVRTDRPPRLAAVGGRVNVLASHVHGVVVVRRDRDRERPVHAELDLPGVGSHRPLRPRADGARHAGLGVEALDDAGIAASPHDVGIHRIGSRPPRLAAGRRGPLRRRDPASSGDDARAAHGAVVLHLAVHEVGDPVVGRDVVHLADRQSYRRPLPAARRGDQDAEVVADHHAARVLRVRPHVVVVAAPADLLRGLAAVVGRSHHVGREVDLVGVVGHDEHPRVVVGTFVQEPAVVDELPLFPAVVGAPERSALPRLDERVDALRVALSDGDGDLAERRFRQAVPRDPLPRRPAVARNEDPAPGPAALAPPRLDVDLPRAGEEGARIVRIHRQV